MDIFSPLQMILARLPAIGLLYAVYLLIGIVVKASALKAADPGFSSRLRQDFYGLSLTSGYPARLPGVIWSALELVGLVSVY